MNRARATNLVRGIEDAHSGGKIAWLADYVLPRLPVAGLADAMRRLPPEELAFALRHKIIPLVAIPGLKLFVACGVAAEREAKARGFRVVAEAGLSEFHEALRLVHGRNILNKATHGLAETQPLRSARRRFTATQAMLLTFLAGVVGLLWFVMPGRVLGMGVSVAGGFFFLSVIALRLLCLLEPARKRSSHEVILGDEDLPIYSVLIPLFRETAVLDQLLGAIGDFDYPHDKLDIKLILEESDIAMQRAVAARRLPPHMEVIVVPCGRPQTKPRALNYALLFARGELITIYDAEDIPDPRQLRLAASAFARLPATTVCLQAELAFHNPKENWLARQFTIEYATLFGLVLPALAANHLPLPLGGTSNHFRTEILRRAGAWDAFNVTEDADLGIRLARDGFETGTLACRTFEEANIKLGNWLKQRSRWLKGFLATWLVHMREPGQLLKELGASGFWAVQAITLGVFASALLHPFCIAISLALLIAEPPLAPDANVFLSLLAGLNLLVLLLGYGVAMAAGWRALKRLGFRGWFYPLATMPFYWLLMSAAAWMALWEFIVAPSHWNKTEHGISKAKKAARGAVPLANVLRLDKRLAAR